MVGGSNVALLLEQIIASPLRAIVDAQSESARATVEFITSLMKKEGGRLVPESVEIKYTQVIQDVETGELKPEEQKMDVPLITLVPIPYISVDEAEVEFDAKIIAANIERRVKAVPIYATYAGKERTDLSGNIHIKIKAKRVDVPEGVARMITTLSNSLSGR
ncbi:MAG: hypothetical protein DSY33_00690 [Archaeoglobus sp.]|jgi:hypothetical protein|nr:MAG: hypothetical protein DSY33_00690 [Archaeoglobus sp.]